MTRALALLDKPSEASFGMTPVVVDDGGVVRVLGLAPGSAYRGHGLQGADLHELIRGGHALAANAALPDELPEETVALWLGTGFAKRAESLDLPSAPLPALSFDAEGGRFFVGAASSMYPYLERWTVGAFRRFREEHDARTQREIAGLMRWVLPNNPQTLAATWRAAPDPQEELAMQLRTFARGRSPEALREQHEMQLRGGPDDLAELRLVAFTGGTETGRDEVADRFAKQFKLELTRFRPTIDDRFHVPSRLDEAGLKRWRMEQGQAAVDASPLGLAMAVLYSVHLGKKILVVDGVRHRAIRETLRWLRPQRLYVVGVFEDEALRRARVKERGLDPDEVFQHGTEREIAELTKSANRQIRKNASESVLQEIFNELQT
jgi:hypothetical protein